MSHIEGQVTEFPNLPLQNVAAGMTRYANSVSIYFGPWDFTLGFYHAVPFPSPQDPTQPAMTQSQVAGVVVSPEHAKALLEILKQNVERWEEQFGEIKLTDDVLGAIGAEKGENK